MTSPEPSAGDQSSAPGSTATMPAGVPSAPPPPPPEQSAQSEQRGTNRWRRPRRRRRSSWPPLWLRDWRSFRAQLRAWWYGRTADDLRCAAADTRRAPGWALLALVVVLWISTGFSWLPLGVGAAAWMLLMLATHWLWWRPRIRARRAGRPLIAAGMAITLGVQAWPWGWLLALGIWLAAMGASEVPRARRRIAAWTCASIARSVRVDPSGLRVVDQAWEDVVPLMLEIDHRATDLAVSNPAVRNAVQEAARWALRHAGHYSVEWPAGLGVFRVVATAPLPAKIEDRPDWGQLPGLLVGATDADTADGTVALADPDTGTVAEQHNVKMVDPNDEKHYLVVGSTGGGKSNFTRGFIARGLREGWFPGGVFLFDGKAGSDYIVFEGREGVHCVARHPEEWQANLDPVDAMMRDRYDQDAEYHRGNRSKPEFPRFLVVLDEVQEMIAELGEKEFLKYLRRWSKQIRAANGRLMVITQRPDAKDAIPGAVKDMLEYIFVLGYVSPVGAREALGQDWRAVVDEYGASTVPGRGMARVGGRLLRLQTVLTDLPTERPELEMLYPPKRDAVAAGEDQGEDAPQGATVLQWAPRPAPPPPPQEPAEGAERPAEPSVDPEAATPPEGLALGDLAAAAGAEPPRPPQRRRTV